MSVGSGACECYGDTEGFRAYRAFGGVEFLGHMEVLGYAKLLGHIETLENVQNWGLQGFKAELGGRSVVRGDSPTLLLR